MNKVCFLLLFISAIFQTLSVEAIKPYQPSYSDPTLDHWRWQLYPELNGLGLQCVAEGPDGAMWFGTEYGVVKYDGKTWVTYNEDDGLVGETVWDLYVTQNGDLFAGSDEGICRFEADRWHRVFPTADLHIRIWDFLEDQAGNLWAGTEWGALCMQGDEKIMYVSRDVAPVLAQFLPHIQTIIVPDSITVWRQPINPLIQNVEARNGFPERGRVLDVYDVFEDRDGFMWFGRDQSGLVVRFAVQDTLSPEHVRWKYYTRGEIDISKKSRVYQTRDGAIWIICKISTACVNRFDGEKWETFTPKSFVGDRCLNFSFLETQDGVLWIGEMGGVFTVSDGKWESYAEDRVPIPKWTPIIDLMEARDGAIWFAGQGKEAARLDYTDTHWKTYNGLLFQCETLDGDTWFLNWDLEAVRFDGETWVRYTVEDGLMDTPVILFATKKGVLWAAGSHQGVAATARFDGEKWAIQKHEKLAWRIQHQAVLEASDGSIWFGAYMPVMDPSDQGGFVRFDGEKWSYEKPAELRSWQRPRGIGETKDGTIWAGGYDLMFQYDGQVWHAVTEPNRMLKSNIKCVLSTREKDLWVGTGTGGAFQFDGKVWTQHTVMTGLPDNDIQSIQQTQDGSVWAETGKGFARFDGQTWTHSVLPVSGGRLYQARDGSLWINQMNFVHALQNRHHPGRSAFQRDPVQSATHRYRPRKLSPETEILVSLKEVSQPGNTVITWDGISPWKWSDDLQFSYRLNQNSWSAYSEKKSITLFEMASGDYTFQVRARDIDFNVDATPAVLSFTVLPPVWKQPWFLILMAVSMSVVGYLSVRLVARNRELNTTNNALSDANKQLYDVNADLQQKTVALAHEMAERERLDHQIQNLQFLYHLRNDLNTIQSPQQMVQIVGEAVQNVLGESGQTNIHLDHTEDVFGSLENPSHRYERSLRWGDQERGRLQVATVVSLSESQERTLLDEVAGQLSRVIEARELQMQLLQSARLVSLGQMAAGVAHELNQPLGAISNVVNDVYLRLRDGIDLTKDALSQMMQDSMGVVKRMSETINHLRVFSRDEAQAPQEPYELNEVVQESLKLVGVQLKNYDVDLLLDLAEGLPPILGHGSQMEQVVLNLLANARDAVMGGKDKRVMIRSFQDGEDVVLEIRDFGVGISEENIARIFEPFFTTKPADKGTGLGLSISYAIVKNHGGELVCDSAVGKGTVFRVVLPIKNQMDAR